MQRVAVPSALRRDRHLAPPAMLGTTGYSHLNRNRSTIITDYASAQRVTHLVILVRFEVGEWSAARSGEGHDFHTSVHQAFVIKLLEDPPGKARDGTLQPQSQSLPFRCRPRCQSL